MGLRRLVDRQAGGHKNSWFVKALQEGAQTTLLDTEKPTENFQKVVSALNIAGEFFRRK